MQFFDRVFNRQTMAVPAGDVLGIETCQLPGLDDHVLQHFVQRMANVQLAVGIGRAIVQHKQGRALTRSTQFFVQTALVPVFHPAGFALGQVAAHGKGRVRQVQRVAVVGALFGHVDRGRGGFDKLSPNAGLFGEIKGDGPFWSFALSLSKGSKRGPERVKFGRVWSGGGFHRDGRQTTRAHRRSPGQCPLSRRPDRRI